jgi:hypothetical protein
LINDFFPIFKRSVKTIKAVKFVNLLFFLFVLQGFIFSQDYVIINDPDQGGFELQFQDTTLSSITNYYDCNNQNDYYYFDLDNDLSGDIQFELYCYLGGEGSTSHIKIAPLGDFQILIDTSYMAFGQYLGDDGQIHDTLYPYVVPHKFMDGDTITLDMVSNTENIVMTTIDEGYDPSAVYLRIDFFLNDTAYIAFYKNQRDSTWIYYLKVYNSSFETIHLLSAYSNDQILSVNEPSPPIAYFYPNPVRNKVTITGNYKYIEIYSIEGVLLFTQKIIESNSTLDLSGLPHGLYFMKMKNGLRSVVQKFVKQ